MKILIISEWFSDKMGYAENFFPKALGEIGHEVHLVTTDLQVYGTSSDYDKVYGDYLGPRIVKQGIFKKDHFTLHRNSHNLSWRGLKIEDLEDKIIDINPDIVYCFEIFNEDTKLVCYLKNKYKYKIFCESRLHLSVFTPPKLIRDKLKLFINQIEGLLISNKIETFYPIAPDVLFVINRYFLIPEKKCKVSSLGVDTDIFSPKLTLDQIKIIREDFQYTEDDIVCIYTGRFTDSKGPLILAEAINYLHTLGYSNFKGLFIGQGESKYQNKIINLNGCKIHPFVEVNRLADLYNSFDIGIWPLQESTSQLDAAACGMPIILDANVKDNFRTEGNGLRYFNHDYKDLAIKILSLSDKSKRKELGVVGRNKIVDLYSWASIAKSRVSDFNKAIQHN